MTHNPQSPTMLADEFAAFVTSDDEYGDQEFGQFCRERYNGIIAALRYAELKAAEANAVPPGTAPALRSLDASGEHARGLREAAKIVQGRVVAEHFREWPELGDGNRVNGSGIVTQCDALAAAILALIPAKAAETVVIEPKGCPTPGACSCTASAVADARDATIAALEEENADLTAALTETLERASAMAAKLEATLAEATGALEGMLAEWDKLTRYGSPLAKSANENVRFARAFLAAAQKQGSGE